jgi:hypothetical protein
LSLSATKRSIRAGERSRRLDVRFRGAATAERRNWARSESDRLSAEWLLWRDDNSYSGEAMREMSAAVTSLS